MVLSKVENTPNEEEDDDKPVAEEEPEDAGERTVRKSTRTSVIVRQAERDAIRAALQATMKVNSLHFSFQFCYYWDSKGSVLWLGFICISIILSIFVTVWLFSLSKRKKKARRRE